MTEIMWLEMRQRETSFLFSRGLLSLLFSRYRAHLLGERRPDPEVDPSLSLSGEVQNERSCSSSSPQDFMACTREFYIYWEGFAMKQVKFASYDIRKKSRIFCGFTTLLFLRRVIYEMTLMEIRISVS